MAEQVRPTDVELAVGQADRVVGEVRDVAGGLASITPRRGPRARAERELREATAAADHARTQLAETAGALGSTLPTVEAVEQRRRALDGQISERLDGESLTKYTPEIARIRSLADKSIQEMRTGQLEKSRELMDEAEAKLTGLVTIIALEKRLVDAPQELTEALRASFQDYGLSEKRIKGLIELSEFFISNKQYITPQSSLGQGIIQVSQVLKRQIDAGQEFTDENNQELQEVMQRFRDGVGILKQQKLAGIDGMIEHLQDLGMRDAPPSFIQGMYVRVKELRTEFAEQGTLKEDELALYEYILAQYETADSAFRKKLATWSDDLVTGRKDEATVRNEIRDHLIADIESQEIPTVGGLHDAIVGLKTDEATLQQVYTASGLQKIVETYLKSYQSMSSEQLEQFNGIHERIFAAMASSDSTQMQIQIELSQLYANKLTTPEKRAQLHGISLTAGEHVQETAVYIEITKTQLAILELHETARQKKQIDLTDLYSRPIEYMDRLLEKIANGEELTDKERTAYGRMQILYLGKPEQIASFVAGDGIHTLDPSLRTLGNVADITGKARDLAFYGTIDILHRAQDAIEGDKSQEEFLVYILGANACSRPINDRDVATIADEITRMEIESLPVEKVRWILEAELRKQKGMEGIPSSSVRRNIQAYYDAAEVLFARGDVEGAERVRDLADLYCRAAKQPGEKEIPEFVRTVLGDYRGSTALGDHRILDMLLEEGNPQRFVPTTLSGPLGTALISGNSFINTINSSEDEKLVALLPVGDTKRIASLESIQQEHDSRLMLLEFQRTGSKIIGTTPTQQTRIGATYTAQSGYHERKATVAEKAGRILEADIQTQEAERIDYERITTMAEGFSTSYSRGLELVQQARTMRKAGTPEADVLEQKGLRMIYLSQQGQQALLQLHSSITTIRTIHRYRGRKEYDEAAQILLELSKIEEPELDDTQRRMIAGASYTMLEGGAKVGRERQIQHTVARFVKSIEAEQARLRELDQQHGSGREEGAITLAATVEHAGATIEAGTPLLDTQARMQELELAKRYARRERFGHAQKTLKSAVFGIQLDQRKVDIHQQHAMLFDMADDSQRDGEVLRTEIKTGNDGEPVVVGFDYRGLMEEVYSIDMTRATGNFREVELRLATFPKRVEFAQQSQMLLLERGSFERQAEALMQQYADTTEGKGMEPETKERTQESRQIIASGAATLAAELDAAAGKVDDEIDRMVNGTSTPESIDQQLEYVRIQLDQFTANQPLMIRRMYQKTGLEVNAGRLASMEDKIERTHGEMKEGEIGEIIVHHASELSDTAHHLRLQTAEVVHLIDGDIAELSRGGVGSGELDGTIDETNQRFASFASVYQVGMQRLSQMEYLRQREVELTRLEHNLGEFGKPQEIPQGDEKIDYAAIGAHQQVLDAVLATGITRALAGNAKEVREDLVQTSRVLGTSIDVMLTEGYADTFKPEYSRDLIWGIYQATNGFNGRIYNQRRIEKGGQAVYEEMVEDGTPMRKGLAYLQEHDQIRPGLHAQLTADLEFSRISTRVDQFNAGAQLAMSCLEDSIMLFDNVDQYVRTHGYSPFNMNLRWRAADLLQIGRAAASDPEGITRKILSGGQVSLPAIEVKIRDRDGVYDDAKISAGADYDDIPHALYAAMHGYLDSLQTYSVGFKHVEGDRFALAAHREPIKLADLYTTATFAKMGIAWDEDDGWTQVRLTPEEHKVVLAHATGTKDIKGISQLLGDYFGVHLGLTTIWSYSERKQMYDVVATYADHDLEVINGVLQNRLQGGKPATDEYIQGLYAETSDFAGQYDTDYGRLLKEGQSSESTARGIQAGVELTLALGLTATGFGAVVGVGFGTKALHDLAENSRRSGGFSQMGTAEQVLGVGGVVLGFGGAALGSLSGIANESLAVGRVTMFSSMMGTGGRGITVLGGGLMAGGLGMAGYGAYESGKAWIHGDIGGLEFFTTGVLGVVQATAPVGAHVAPTRTARAWRVAGTSQDTRGAKIFRGVMTGLTGETVHTMSLAETTALRAQHGKRFGQLGETQKTLYGQMELRLGRSLTPEEGLVFMDRIPTRKVGGRTEFRPLGAAATEKFLAEAEVYFLNPPEAEIPGGHPHDAEQDAPVDRTTEMRERRERAAEQVLHAQLKSRFIEPGEDGTTYRLGRGEEQKTYSSEHVDTALRIVSSAERILNNPEFASLPPEQKRAFVAEALRGQPEKVQRHAMELALNPEYLANRKSRARQLEFGLDAAMKIPEIARQPEAIVIRAMSEEQRLLERPVTVENLRETITRRKANVSRFRGEAKVLREAGETARAKQLEEFATRIEQGTEKLAAKLRTLEPVRHDESQEFVERKRAITDIEVDGKRPWSEITEQERAAAWPEIKRLYDEAYGAADLHYSNPEKLFTEVTPIWFVAREGGRIVAFATASRTPRGELRIGLFGATQEGQAGRTAIHSLVRRLTTSEDTYSLVSGRPAHLVRKYEGEFTLFEEAKIAMGSGIQRGELSPTKPGKNLKALRRMAGFETSEIVLEASKRTGRPVAEIKFEDLVDQAAIRGEIPDTPEAKARCFAVSQDIEGSPTIVIKLMVGHPRKVGAQARVTETAMPIAVGAEGIEPTPISKGRRTRGPETKVVEPETRAPVVEPESIEAGEFVRLRPSRELFKTDDVVGHVLRRAGVELIDGELVRTGQPEWLIGHEAVAGEEVSIGRMVRSIEDVILSDAMQGQEMDVIVIRPDKKSLSQINKMFGEEVGDQALGVYQDIIQGAVRRIIGDSQEQTAHIIRPPSGGGDEAVGIIIVPKGKGEDVRTRLGQEMRAVTDAEFQRISTASDGSGRLRYSLSLMTDPLRLIEASYDISRPVTVGRAEDGRAVAVHADGSDAMLQRSESRIGFLEGLITRAEEDGSLSFAPSLRERLGVRTGVGWKLSESIGQVGDGETVSGTAFEVRLQIDDNQAYVDIGGRLPGVERTVETPYLEITGKGYAEVERNAFGLRGFNTFLGHDGANYLVSTVEAAVARYATEHGVTVRRLGTMKYVIEGGTPADATVMARVIDEQLHSAGVKMSVQKQGAVPIENANFADAMASISNGRLRMLWGSENYDSADAIIAAMAIGNDDTLTRLGLGKLRDITEVIRKNPQLRKVEDLVIKLRRLPEPRGADMLEAFQDFVLTEGRTFEIRRQAITRSPDGMSLAIVDDAPRLAPVQKRTGEPDHAYRYRVRQQEREVELAVQEQQLGKRIPESTKLGRRLHLIAEDSKLGTANERMLAEQLGSDATYQEAIRTGSLDEAIAIADRYGTVLEAIESSPPTMKQGAYVDVIQNARQVIAIGDVHGDVYGVVDQFLRQGILIDTMEGIPRTLPKTDPRYVPPAKRYRLNPDLPEGSQIVFMGDYIDRGPTSVDVVELVSQMKSDGGQTGTRVHALRGNHEELFRRFVEFYRGSSDQEVRAVFEGKANADDIMGAMKQWSRVGVDQTFESIIERYGSWENFIHENYDQQGRVIEGSFMHFIEQSRAAVIIDNNYFTHGGPVLQSDGQLITSPEMLDAHFQRLFTTADNHWGTVFGDIRVMESGDYSSAYVEGRHGWAPIMSQEIAAQWREALGVDHIYVGHSRGKGVRAAGGYVTNLDASMSEAYGRGSGFVVIDPLRKTAPARLHTSRAPEDSPHLIGVADDSHVPTDFTNGRDRTTILRNPISQAADDVYAGREVVVKRPDVTKPPSRSILGMEESDLPSRVTYEAVIREDGNVQFNFEYDGVENILLVRIADDGMTPAELRTYYEGEISREVNSAKETHILDTLDQSLSSSPEMMRDAVMAGAKTIRRTAPEETRVQMLEAYSRTVAALDEHLHYAQVEGFITIGQIGNVLGFAAKLHLLGVDPVPLLSHEVKPGVRNGLLDNFRPTDVDSFRMLEQATETSRRLLDRIPLDQITDPDARGAVVKHIFEYLFDDVSRLPTAESREAYMQLIGSNLDNLDFGVLSEALAIRVDVKVGRKTRQETILLGDITADRADQLSVRPNRLPFATYLLPETGPVPRSLVLRALSSDAIRKELRSHANFRQVADLMDNIFNSSGNTTVEPWLRLVGAELEYIARDGATKADKAEFLGSSRTRGKIDYMDLIYNAYLDGKVSPADLARISRNLIGPDGGVLPIDAFTQTVSSEIGKLFIPSDVQLPAAFILENIDLIMDYTQYRGNLTEAAPRSTQNLVGYYGPQEGFGEAAIVFDQAIRAMAEGRFQEFKFSDEFRGELISLVGEERGSRIFETWRQNHTADQVTVGDATHTILETGSFEDGFYGGRVRGERTCQDISQQTFHIAGIVGTVELPWIKQIVIKNPAGEIIYRRRIFLMQGDDGNPILVAQPKYGAKDMPGLAEIDTAVMASIRTRYEEMGIGVRDIDHAYANDIGPNAGYRTFTSGRSPYYYMDSNGYVVRAGREGIVFARHGLHYREPGTSEGYRQPDIFQKGWNERRDITGELIKD